VKCTADNGGHEHDETEPQRAADKASRCHPPPPPIPGVGHKKSATKLNPIAGDKVHSTSLPAGEQTGRQSRRTSPPRRVADQELIKIERVFQIIIRRRRKPQATVPSMKRRSPGSLSRMSPARSAPERNRRARPAAAAGAPRRSAHRADGLPIPFRLLAPDIRPPSFCNRNSSRKIACPSRNVGI
jgi:hypothetical protein